MVVVSATNAMRGIKFVNGKVSPYSVRCTITFQLNWNAYLYTS